MPSQSTRALLLFIVYHILSLAVDLCQVFYNWLLAKYIKKYGGLQIFFFLFSKKIRLDTGVTIKMGCTSNKLRVWCFTHAHMTFGWWHPICD